MLLMPNVLLTASLPFCVKACLTVFDTGFLSMCPSSLFCYAGTHCIFIHRLLLLILSGHEMYSHCFKLLQKLLQIFFFVVIFI